MNAKHQQQRYSPISLNLARLRRDIRPFRLHWFPCLRSTNDHAAVLRRRGELFAPAMVLTGRQTAGRGRAGRSWWSGPGVITVTFIMPIQEHVSPHQVPLIAGLAVRQAAAELSGEPEIQLKWPNDIIFRNRKLAGLLCERVHRADLIGLGLNLNTPLPPNMGPGESGIHPPPLREGLGEGEAPPVQKITPHRAAFSSREGSFSTAPPPSLRPHIISLAEIAGHPFDPTDALATLARHIHQALSLRDRTPFAQLSREYDRHHALIGRRISVLNGIDTPAVTGKCEGIDSTGRLLLRHRGALHRVIAGHVIAD